MAQNLQERKNAFKDIFHWINLSKDNQATFSPQQMLNINHLIDELDEDGFNALFHIYVLAENDGWNEGYDWGMHAMHKAAKERGVDIEMP